MTPSARGLLDAADAEPLLGQAEAAAFFAHQVVRRHHHVLEDDLPRGFLGEGAVLGGQADARRVHVHQEAGDAPA